MMINSLCKSYEVSGRTIQVLKGLTFTPEPHGITVILGRSGSGKTTLLRLIAGLEAADSGAVEELGEKRAGVIFQEPRLMPWLTVEDNILFGVGKSKKGSLPGLMELTGLMGFEHAYPSQLSGGMQQRVALARALAYEPQVLLMDEPFAALDYFTRRQMQQELLRICGTQGKAVLFVTHSIDEALTIGRKIIILADGGCRREYDLREDPFPRELFSERMIKIKKEIMNYMED